MGSWPMTTAVSSAREEKGIIVLGSLKREAIPSLRHYPPSTLGVAGGLVAGQDKLGSISGW